MDFDILVGSWARVAEDLAGDLNHTAVQSATPLCQNSVGPGTLTVDGPFCVAVSVADGDGEAAIVGPDHIDNIPRRAVYTESSSFTSVRRPVRLTC